MTGNAVPLGFSLANAHWRDAAGTGAVFHAGRRTAMALLAAVTAGGLAWGREADAPIAQPQE